MLKWIGLIFLTLAQFEYSLLSNQRPSFLTILPASLGLIGYPIILFYIVKEFHRVKRPFCFFLRLGGLAVITQLARLAAQYYPVVVLPHLSWTNNILVPLTLSVLMLTGLDLTSRSDAARNISGARPVFDGIPIRPNAGMALGILLILISFFATLILETDSSFYWMMTALFIYISYDRESGDVSLSLLLFSMVMLNLGNIGFSWLVRRSVEIGLIFCLTLLVVPLIGLLGNPSGKTSRPDKPAKRKKAERSVRAIFYLWYPSLMILLAVLEKYQTRISAFFR